MAGLEAAERVFRMGIFSFWESFRARRLAGTENAIQRDSTRTNNQGIALGTITGLRLGRAGFREDGNLRPRRADAMLAGGQRQKGNPSGIYITDSVQPSGEVPAQFPHTRWTQKDVYK